MARWLLRADGTFSVAARLALAAVVAAGFAAGFAVRPAGHERSTVAAVESGRIEADLPAAPAQPGPALTSAAALPRLGAPARSVRVVATPGPTVTPEPTATATPAETVTPEPTPAATVTSPAPTAAPPAAPPPPPPPEPTPAGTIFDSSG